MTANLIRSASDSAKPEAAPRLNALQLFGYGLLSFPISLAGLTVVTFAPTTYALDFGLGLAAVGVIFGAGRVLDVVTDPLIGYFSDRTRSRWGPRLPWMVWGGLLFCLMTGLLLAPPVSPGLAASALIVTLFFLALTLADLPYSATGLELSPHPHERTVLASVKAAFQIAGALASALIMTAYAEDPIGGLKMVAWVSIVTAGAGVGLFWSLVPRRWPTVHKTSAQGLRKALTHLQHQPGYGRLLLAFCLAQAGSAFTIALTTLFVLKQIGCPELTGAFMGLVLLSSALALPFWTIVSKRVGKHKAWSLALAGGLILLLCAPLLTLNGPLLYAVFCALFGLTISADAVLPTTLLADIVAQSEADAAIKAEGQGNDAGLMLGLKNAVSKLGFAGPMLIAFPLLGWVGIAEADGLAFEQSALLLLLYAALPALLRLAALIIFNRTGPRAAS